VNGNLKKLPGVLFASRPQGEQESAFLVKQHAPAVGAT